VLATPVRFGGRGGANQCAIPTPSCLFLCPLSLPLVQEFRRQPASREESTAGADGFLDCLARRVYCRPGTGYAIGGGLPQTLPAKPRFELSAAVVATQSGPANPASVPVAVPCASGSRWLFRWSPKRGSP
jgi:hypothetical protein